MAALTSAGASSGFRWLGTAFLHGLQRVFWPQNLYATTAVVDEAPTTKRHYPPQRDRTIEHAAMRREMFRL